MILIHHPDKTQSFDSSQESEAFLLVQKAWEILGTPEKKKGYDSAFDFDEWIPGPFEEFTEVEFFDIFAPVFERNARFSNKKPVPSLGDMKSSDEKVLNFYNFWSSFDSWRDFSKFDEFKDGDIENASGRDERRWMNKQNENIRSKKKKKEKERLNNLVERAKKNDPRLKRIKEKEEKIRLLKVQEKEDKVNKVKLEKKMKEDEERSRVEREKERVEKEKEERRRKILLTQKKVEFSKQICQRALTEEIFPPTQQHLLKQGVNYLVENRVEYLNLALEGLNLSEKVESFGIEKINQFCETILVKAEELFKEKEAEELKMRSGGGREKDVVEKVVVEKKESWSAEELSMLAKACKKFPGGMRRRWETVSEYLNNQCGNNRTAEECVEMVKSLGDKTKSVSAEDAFNTFQKSLKKKEEQVQEDASAKQDEWTEEEQKLLEKGLREFPQTMEKNERWKKIAELVGSKNRKQCVERFKTLREQIISSKTVAK